VKPRDGSPGRYAVLHDLASRGEGAFVPFVVLGDPDPARSLEIALTLARSGADALELGLPFSDPVADGPEVQAATLRALRAGTRIEGAWSIVARIRRERPALPIGLLVYANRILDAGAGAFYSRAGAEGVDSVLVADAPLLEMAPFERAAAASGVCPVLIAPPNAGGECLAEVARRSRGYVYVTSRRGVTGADREPRAEAASVLARLGTLRSAPPLLGFGISTPAHVRDALALGAAGAISGSAIASIIARGIGDTRGMLREIADFVAAMKAATRRRA
jgi:tryptophan synthase alpha chain